MKKILLIAAMLFLALGAYAQKYSFTVYAEPQITWMSPDSRNLDSEGSMIGFNGGLNFDNFFTDNYAFSTGVSINNINGKLNYTEGGTLQGLDSLYSVQSGEVAEYRLQYINVPIGLKFKTIEIGYTRFYAHLGLDTYINIKSKANLPREEDIDIGEEIQWYNLGYYIGGGIEYSIGGTTALVAGIAYNNGFTDITVATDEKVTVGTFSLRLGIKF
jgi:hypothetical protein